MKTFSIIAAMDTDRGLGKDNDLAWRIPADMAWFKAHTMTPSEEGKINACIMGRKTWESLPDSFKPLPGRLNVVLTSNENYPLPGPAADDSAIGTSGVIRAGSLDEALGLLSESELADQLSEIFVIGGAQLYETAMQHPALDRLILTYVWKSYGCDCFFPEWNSDQFVGLYASNVYVGVNQNHSFKVFQKIS